MTDIKYCRFYKRQYFHAAAEDFYRNFLETPRTFRAWSRFAGPAFHTGFYFASTAFVARAETRHYENMWLPSRYERPQSPLHGLGGASRYYVFVEVTISVDRIVDFTNAQIVREYLVHGHAAATDLKPAHDVEYLKLLASDVNGGDALTCTLGADARRAGHNGILFPSIRAAACDAYTQEDLQAYPWLVYQLPDRPGVDPRDLLKRQLQHEHNLVIFSGSRLTRAIRSYTWLDGDGHGAQHENPYWDFTAAKLEAVRIEERCRLGLDQVGAREKGLLSDAEIEQEFAASLTYIRTGNMGAT